MPGDILAKEIEFHAAKWTQQKNWVIFQYSCMR